MSIFTKSGGYGTDTTGVLITLNAKVGLASGNVSTFRKGGASSGYQVTAGKTFIITKIVTMHSAAADVAFGIGLGYADNDVGNDTTTARTTPINVLGFPEATTLGAIGGVQANPAGASGWMNPNPYLQDLHLIGGAAEKYMYMKVISSAGISISISVIIIGYEI